MTELHDYRFAMYMRIGGDVWGLWGRVYGHPTFADGQEIMVSVPRVFDEVNMVITTYSGSKYKLVNCAAWDVAVHQEIRSVIKRGDYTYH